jgi:hypothetical protein
MDRIFPPQYQQCLETMHERVDTRVRLRLRGKEDQILRTEKVIGGETGGEWLSGTQSVEATFAIPATVDIEDRPGTATAKRCVVLLLDELLMAARLSGAGVLLQQECDCFIPVVPHWCAIRLQQPRSASVMVMSDRVHAITGNAASSSASVDTTTLAASFTEQVYPQESPEAMAGKSSGLTAP